MMKRFVLLILMICAFASVRAQTKVNDSTRVYDTVTDADTFYLFQTPKPSINPGRSATSNIGRVLLQEYVATERVTVYGVAITFTNQFGPVYDTVSVYRALLMNGRVHNVGPYYSMQLVDSVSLNRSHPRFCWFKYTYEENGKEEYLVTPCYELYFDTPQQINQMSDTFYVGRYGGTGFRQEEYGGLYSSSLPGHLWQGMGYSGGDENGLFYLRFGTTDYLWGVYFPIIGLRCGSMPYYSLDAYAGDSAVLRWRNAELGTLYNVRLVGSDGSDTTYVTADTSLALGGLADTVRYNVMLRKQCRYTTTNYDTTVYGAWLSTLSFGHGPEAGVGVAAVQGEAFFLVPNPARERVSVVLPASMQGGRLSVLDMAGRERMTLPVQDPVEDLDVSALSPGIYLVRITTARDVSTRRLLVLRD
jgi:hypothetical protein